MSRSISNNALNKKLDEILNKQTEIKDVLEQLVTRVKALEEKESDTTQLTANLNNVDLSLKKFTENTKRQQDCDLDTNTRTKKPKVVIEKDREAFSAAYTLIKATLRLAATKTVDTSVPDYKMKYPFLLRNITWSRPLDGQEDREDGKASCNVAYWRLVCDVLFEEAKKSANATISVVGYLKPAWLDFRRRTRADEVQKKRDGNFEAKEKQRKMLSALPAALVKAVFHTDAADLTSAHVTGFAAMCEPPVVLTSDEAAAILVELPNAKPKFSMHDNVLCHAYPDWLSANGVNLFQGFIATEKKSRQGKGREKLSKAFTSNLKATSVPTEAYPMKGVHSPFLIKSAEPKAAGDAEPDKGPADEAEAADGDNAEAVDEVV